MLLQLKSGAVYGPVRSRRLGDSLGINVMPNSVKVCTFNCLYCQYGWMKVCPLKIAEQNQWPPVQGILDELEETLWELGRQPAYITFSGNGEPTLHPRFAELVDGVTALRNRYAPRARTAILSNSVSAVAAGMRLGSVHSAGTTGSSCLAGVDYRSVCDALARLDLRIMKLDCGTDRVLHRYNRPCGGIRVDDIVQGLMKLDDICIQALLAGGEMGNAEPGEIAAWVDAVSEIQPFHVQVYTLDRGYASSRIAPLSAGRLEEIRRRLDRAGIDADVY